MKVVWEKLAYTKRVKVFLHLARIQVDTQQLIQDSVKIRLTNVFQMGWFLGPHPSPYSYYSHIYLNIYLAEQSVLY